MYDSTPVPIYGCDTSEVVVEASTSGWEPARSPINYANGRDVAPVVMGTHRQPGLDRTLLGSAVEMDVYIADSFVITNPDSAE